MLKDKKEVANVQNNVKTEDLAVNNEKTADEKSAQKSINSTKAAKNTSKKEKSPKKKPEPKAKSKKTKEKSEKKKGEKFNFKYLSGLLFAKMMRGGASELRKNAEEVNKLNVFPVPDGDTGDNMRMTIESGIAAIENLDSDDLAEVMKVLSHGMLLGARGNSGVILSQLFAGIAKGFVASDKADPVALGKALELGVEQAYTSVVTPTEGTILTVAREAVEYAVSRITPKSTIRTLFADLVKEMHASLDRTPETLSVLKEAGVVDSGGAGLFFIMDGLNRVLNGEEIEEMDSLPAEGVKPAPDLTSFGPDSEMTYGYCTELLVQLQNSKTNVDAFDIEELKAFLSLIGDSVVAFKTDSIIKIHVHTLTPDKVLRYCRKVGAFITVKIENMSLQHTDLMSEKSEEASAPLAQKKKYGVVAVSNGPGVEALFRDLGTDEIILGGQTNNPSTNDFLNAFDKINAEHIFVLPNNGNIVMAANQAAEIYEKAKIHVIPAKNIGAGYVALSTMNFEAESVEEILVEAEDSIKRITTGYISPAVRDVDMNGVHVTEGDTIGIIGKSIVVSEADRANATNIFVTKLLDVANAFMLTVFCGADVSNSEKEALSAYISEKHPGTEFYFIDGGQEVYPYIFVAE